MKHRANKIKFKDGIDANKMLMRKLFINFVSHGHLTTTEKKAKVLKSYIEKLVEKTKKQTEADKNYLLTKVASSKIVETLFKQIGAQIENRIGGYARVEKLHARVSDGAPMAKVSWSVPMVKEEPKAKEVKTTKKTVKATKEEAQVPAAK